MREHEALVAEARGQAKCYSEGGLRALIRSLADALEMATVERAVVEAQALEQAADSIVRTSDGDDSDIHPEAGYLSIPDGKWKGL